MRAGGRIDEHQALRGGTTRLRLLRWPLGAALLLALVMVLAVAAPASAAVWTDQDDYVPGSVVTISGDNSDGAGYLPGETVVVDIAGPHGWAAQAAAVVGDGGAWSCRVTLAEDDSAVGSYSFVAVGQTSGVSQAGSFTDGPTVKLNSVLGGPTYRVDWEVRKEDGSTVASGTTAVSYKLLGDTYSIPAPGVGQYLLLTAYPNAEGSASNQFFKEWSASGSGAVVTTEPGDGRTIRVNYSTSTSTWTFTAKYAERGVKLAAALGGPVGLTPINYTVDWELREAGTDELLSSDSTGVTYSLLGGSVYNLPFLGSGQYLLLTARTNADGDNAGLSFANWSASSGAAYSTVGDGRTIRIDAWPATGTWTFTAHYVDKAPKVTIPLLSLIQFANEEMPHSFVLGKFSDTSDGPWTVDVDWGDGTAPTVFAMDADGAIPDTSHTYAAKPHDDPLGTNSYTVRVTVTDSVGLAGSATFTATVANAPPKAAYSSQVTGAECGGSLLVKPTFTLTDAAGDLPSDPDKAFGYMYLPLGSVFSTMTQLLQDPSQIDWGDLLANFNLSDFDLSKLGVQKGLPNGLTVTDWNLTTDADGDTATGTIGGTARVKAGLYLIWAVDRYGASSLITQLVANGWDISSLTPLFVAVIPDVSIGPFISVGQYSDALWNPANFTVTAGSGEASAAKTSYLYYGFDQLGGIGGQLGKMVQTPVGQWLSVPNLTNLVQQLLSSAGAALTSFKPGLPDGLSLDLATVSEEDGLEIAKGRIGGTATGRPGVYLVMVSDGGGSPALALWACVVLPKDALLTCGPATGAPGEPVTLKANVRVGLFAADSTPGDFARLWVRFRITDSAGNLVATQYAQVEPGGSVGGGTATTAFSSPVAGTFKYQVDLVRGDGDPQANDYYIALPWSATLTVKTPPPAAPSGLTATPLAGRKIQVAWTDNANNETGFIVQRSTNKLIWTTIAAPTASDGVGGTVSVTSAGLTANVRYYYRVQAVHASGASAWTAAASAVAIK